MGFFSDLKEDLSRAVNELNGEIDVNEEEVLEEQDRVTRQPRIPEPPTTADKATGEFGISLEEMLDNIDALEREAADETDDFDMALPEEREIEEVPEDPQEEQPARIQSYGESKGVGEEMETNPARVAVNETSVIAESMKITGDIVTEGSVNLMGTLNGNIEVLGKLSISGHINGNSKAAEVYAEGAKIDGEIVSEGAVKIGVSSVVTGNITATSAAIAGAVKGDIDVRGPVILDASAIVMGNIKSRSVQINNGAVIEGMCSQCYADVSPTSFFDDYKPEIRKSKSK